MRNQFKYQIDEIKKMKKFPRYFLAKYFDELKTKVDLKYALKIDEKEKYLEIINNIETFEQDAYNRWKSKNICAFDDEINILDENLVNIEKLQLNKSNDLSKIITIQINLLKYKIEKMLFGNKTISYIDKDSNLFLLSDSFLLIINDEYISETNYEIFRGAKDGLLTKNELNINFLRCILKEKNEIRSNVLNLHVNINQIFEIILHVSSAFS